MSDAKTSKPIALGKFKPLLAGTSLARICTAALPGNTVTGQFAPPASVGPIARRSRVRHQHPFPFSRRATSEPPPRPIIREKTLGTSWQRCDIQPNWLIGSFFFGIGIKPKRELDRK